MPASSPKGTAPRAAHRPSRRAHVIESAVAVFADLGYAEASVNDIAEAADVVVSGIYYHFGGKEQLFDAAIELVYASLDDAIEEAQEQHPTGSPEALAAAIHAGNAWTDVHPHASKLLYSQLPGATLDSARMRDEHEANHVAAAHRYLERTHPAPEDRGTYRDEAGELAARTLVRLMVSVMPLRLEGGHLSKRSPRALEASLQTVGAAIIFD